MNDLQLLIVTALLGGVTYVAVKYLGKIFNRAAASVAASANNGVSQKKRKITPEIQDHDQVAKDTANEQKVLTDKSAILSYFSSILSISSKIKKSQ
jgi:hypothetical protein